MRGSDMGELVVNGDPETLARVTNALQGEPCRVTYVPAVDQRAGSDGSTGATLGTVQRSGTVARNPHAAALGRLGGIVGGKARAEKLSASRRRASAGRPARARWTKTRAARQRARSPAT